MASSLIAVRTENCIHIKSNVNSIITVHHHFKVIDVFNQTYGEIEDEGFQVIAKVSGVTIVKPIVFGNVARYFGKKRDEDGHTHQWTVYLKPYKNEDMSAYVKKVTFKLHESYPNSNRVVTKPPYEVTESGWGEFEVIIKIYFNDPHERAVTVYHLLKLFQSETDIMLGKKSLVSEFYDEMVFNDPTIMMQHMLNGTRPLSIGAYKHDSDFEEKKEKTLTKVQNAKTKIRFEITELNERLKQKKQTIQKLKDEISKLEKGNDQLELDGDLLS